MTKKRLLILLSFVFIFVSLTGTMPSVLAQDDGPFVEVVNDYYTVEHYSLADGTALERAIINGPAEPLIGYEEETTPSLEPLPSEGVISNFPSYDWVFGCSAVSGAMIAAYYDRNGYGNMYSGPTNGGVMPLTDTSWPTWSDGAGANYPNNPLIASNNGVDGRSTKERGSIDDYWVEKDSTAKDPYITGSWTQHTWGSAIGDYMKTSQSAFPYSNFDGSTSFWNYADNTILTCSAMEGIDGGGYMISEDDGTYGRKEFYEARGYTVTECWNQKTYNQYTGGFSLADLQAEIDAGHPVLINMFGHSMVAYGYSGSTVYIRNTWDNDPSNTYTMIWDSTPSYDGMDLYSVSIVKVQGAAPTVPTPIGPTATIGVDKPRYQWSEISSATAYQVQLYKGSTLKYTKTVYSPYCICAKCMKKFWTSLTDATYKWRVRAKVGGAWKAWSAFKWFKVDAVPSTILPSGWTGTDTPKFKWSKNVDAANYHIQVRTQAGGWVYLKTVWGPYCTSTACMKRFWSPDLSNGYYKWRVQARVNGIWMPWSGWENFRVQD